MFRALTCPSSGDKIVFTQHLVSSLSVNFCRARAEPVGTRAETSFRLSPKRTSPFKSAGKSVQSTAGSRGVRISVSNAGYTTPRGRVRVYWLPTPFASISFTSPPVRHRVPQHSERSSPVYCTAVYRERRYQMLCEYNFSS